MSIQDSLDSLSKAYFADISEKISRIYVDMEILQDLRIGALLKSTTVPVEIEYLQSRIPEYNQRLDLETAKHFPVLNKTDEELDAIIKENPLSIALISPWTNIYNNFMIVLQSLYMKTSAKDTTAAPLLVVVNTASMTYPIQLFAKLADQIRRVYPGATVKSSAYQRYEAEPDMYINTDMFFLYDHEKFFNSSFINTMMSEKNHKTKVIYTTPYVNKNLGLDKSEYMKGLVSTGATLNLFFDFFYMPPGINWEPNSNVEKEQSENSAGD